ncbi:MAG: electron transfer flavoprotein subunit alpha/FixB family protein [bacterium]|nr:electron transfer flavoprotein subunit alpha/FixB family protein [bacterium]
MSHNGIWIVAEAAEGDLKSISVELLAAARPLADALGQPVGAVLLGHEVSPLAQKLIAFGADRVIVADHAALQPLRTEPALETLTHVFEEFTPEAILFGNTPLGKDVAGRLGVRFGTTLTTDCTKLEVVEGLIHKTHPVFGGSNLTVSTSEIRPQMATIRPKAFARGTEDAGRSGEVIPFAVDDAWVTSRTTVKDVIREAARKLSVTDAEIIVTGGRGMGGPENWHLIEGLAAELNAATGASRAVVDAGWRPHGEQVGQTGKTVSPKLYVACGVSGAIQHLVGMRSSRYIIAINTDAEAPIMKVANVAIVGDVHEVIPQLIAEFKAARQAAAV